MEVRNHTFIEYMSEEEGSGTVVKERGSVEEKEREGQARLFPKEKCEISVGEEHESRDEGVLGLEMESCLL